MLSHYFILLSHTVCWLLNCQVIKDYLYIYNYIYITLYWIVFVDGAMAVEKKQVASFTNVGDCFEYWDWEGEYLW